MSISMELADHDADFHALPVPPELINNLASATEAERDALNNRIYTSYSDDVMTNLPSCACGTYKGNYYSGVHCKSCDTVVTSPLEENVAPILWMKAPDGIASLFNPHAWMILSSLLKIGTFDVLRWITDTTSRQEAQVPIFLNEMLLTGAIKRGYNNFVENYDSTLVQLFSHKRYEKRSKSSEESLAFFLNNKGRILSTYLPIPNKSVLVIETTQAGDKYVDAVTVTAVDAIRTITSIDVKPINLSVKENRVAKTIAGLAKFYHEYYGNNLGSKEGIFRQNICGTKAHMSFRGVISSITEPHEYDEIHVPWAIGVSVLRLHLLNLLTKKGYGIDEAFAKLNAYADRYDQELDEMFKWLISTSPRGGIAATSQRNPSLERSSFQAVRITKIKTDISDPSIGISILTVKGKNADFDGDALNFMLAIDSTLAHELRHLEAHTGIGDLSGPRKTSKNISMPKPVLANIHNWLTDDTVGNANTRKAQEMVTLFG